MSDDNVCPGCNGKGRYVGLRKVEDPCKVCDGTGETDKGLDFSITINVERAEAALDDFADRVREALLQGKDGFSGLV